jgi:hypothetical protein
MLMAYCRIVPLAVLAGCAAAGDADRISPGSDRQGSVHDASTDTACVHPNWPQRRVCCGRPEDRPGDTCYPWSTLDNVQCRKEGEIGNLKHALWCCGDLKYSLLTKPIVEPGDGGACTTEDPRDPSPDRVCTQCGNGDCGIGENRCNCPGDCS